MVNTDLTEILFNLAERSDLSREESQRTFGGTLIMSKWCFNYDSGEYEYIDKDGFSIDRGEYVYNWDDSEYRREEEEEEQRRLDDEEDEW